MMYCFQTQFRSSSNMVCLLQLFKCSSLGLLSVECPIKIKYSSINPMLNSTSIQHRISMILPCKAKRQYVLTLHLQVSRSCLWLCRADWSTSVLYGSSKPDVCLLFRCRRRIQICSTPYRGRTALWGSSWPRKFASCPRKDT